MELSPGVIVGERFRLDALLGSGGMGSVWTATDVKLPRQVALKVLHADLHTDPELAERFRREARLLAGIDHPSIVRVLDVLDIVDDGGRVRPCIVMALAPGRTLADVVRQGGPMKLDHAVAMMRSVLDGLAAAHAAGVVHRDLKPQNIMVEEKGPGAVQARLLDFGIAKGVQDAPSNSSVLATRAGMLLGTPAYMSPEQINEPSRVDARADLWAATVCFFEMLTGQVPFQGRTMAETISNVLTSQRLAAHALNPLLPRTVDAFFTRALAPSIDARPRDAAALRAALEPLVIGLDRTTPMAARDAQALVAKALAEINEPQRVQGDLRSNAMMISAEQVALARASQRPPGGFGALEAPSSGQLIVAAPPASNQLARRVGIGAAMVIAATGGTCVVAGSIVLYLLWHGHHL